MAELKKEDILNFKKDYEKLSDKYGIEVTATVECSSSLLRFLIKIVGPSRIGATLEIKKK